MREGHRRALGIFVALMLAGPIGMTMFVASSLWDSARRSEYLVELKLPDGRALKVRYDVKPNGMRERIEEELRQIPGLVDRATVLNALLLEGGDLAGIIDEEIGHASLVTSIAVALSTVGLLALTWAFVPKRRPEAAKDAAE